MKICLKNCIFINMDEYLTDDKEYIDINHPLSFRGGMDRIFYSQIDDELNVLPENRYFQRRFFLLLLTTSFCYLFCSR